MDFISDKEKQDWETAREEELAKTKKEDKTGREEDASQQTQQEVMTKEQYLDNLLQTCQLLALKNCIFYFLSYYCD